MTTDKIKTGVVCFLSAVFLLYSLFLYAVLPVAEFNSSAQADKGKQLWQDYNCGACHQVYGLGGFLGPDLTNVYSLRGAEYIKAFLIIGNKSMPAFHMTADDMTAILSYLEELDASGSSDPRTFSIAYDGNIEQGR